MKRLRSFALADYIREKKYCSMEELRGRFGISPATLYRDVAELAARDVIRKVRGGVAYAGEFRAPPAYASSAYEERVNWNRDSKEAVARKAFERIGEGDILFLDSSTTVSCLAELLLESRFGNLTIVTNSVSIIRNFHKFPRHYVLISLGGSYDLQLNAFLGQAAMRELERLSISKAFISAFGVADDDVTTNHEHHAALLGKVLQISERRYLLVDSGKFDRRGLFKVVSRRVFDEILSN